MPARAYRERVRRSACKDTRIGEGDSVGEVSILTRRGCIYVFAQIEIKIWVS